MKWKNIINLSKIQVAEFSKLFSKQMFLLPLFILVWPLLTSGGDILSSCNTIARWMLMLPIVLISLMNSMFFFGDNHKLMLPASHLEKYTSIWLSSMILAGKEIILSMAIILPLLYGLNLVSFQEDFGEIGLAMIHAIFHSKTLSSFPTATGCVLFVISLFIPQPKKRMVNTVLALSLVLYLGILFALPQSARNMYNSSLSVILSIGFWIWGYRNFKLIQVYKRK